MGWDSVCYVLGPRNRGARQEAIHHIPHVSLGINYVVQSGTHAVQSMMEIVETLKALKRNIIYVYSTIYARTNFELCLIISRLKTTYR